MMRHSATALLAALLVVLTGSASAEFWCTESGNFLDVHSNCTAYFNCRPGDLTVSEFIKTQFHCDYGMLYSIEEERCLTASNLMCRQMDDGTTESVPIGTPPTLPGTTVTMPTEAQTTVSEPAVTESTTTTEGGDDGDFECEQPGRFPSKTPGCKNYIMCRRQGTLLLKEESSCAADSLFDPQLARCVAEGSFVCDNPATTTEAPVTETDGPATATEEPVTTENPQTTEEVSATDKPATETTDDPTTTTLENPETTEAGTVTEVPVTETTDDPTTTTSENPETTEDATVTATQEPTTTEEVTKPDETTVTEEATDGENSN